MVGPQTNPEAGASGSRPTTWRGTPSITSPRGPSVDRNIVGIRYYRGRVLFAVEGDGVYAEALGTVVPTAALETSIADWNNAGYKVWDRFELAHTGLPSGARSTCTTPTSTPTTRTGSGSCSLPRATGVKTDDFDVKVRRLTMRIESNSNVAETLAPTITGFTIRSAQAPDFTEWVLKRYVLIADMVQKQPNGQSSTSTHRPCFGARGHRLHPHHLGGAGWGLERLRPGDQPHPARPAQYEDALGESVKDVHVVGLTMIASRT